MSTQGTVVIIVSLLGANSNVNLLSIVFIALWCYIVYKLLSRVGAC